MKKKKKETSAMKINDCLKKIDSRLFFFFFSSSKLPVTVNYRWRVDQFSLKFYYRISQALNPIYRSQKKKEKRKKKIVNSSTIVSLIDNADF